DQLGGEWELRLGEAQVFAEGAPHGEEVSREVAGAPVEDGEFVALLVELAGDLATLADEFLVAAREFAACFLRLSEDLRELVADFGEVLGSVDWSLDATRGERLPQCRERLPLVAEVGFFELHEGGDLLKPLAPHLIDLVAKLAKGLA